MTRHKGKSGEERETQKVAVVRNVCGPTRLSGQELKGVHHPLAHQGHTPRPIMEDLEPS